MIVVVSGKLCSDFQRFGKVIQSAEDLIEPLANESDMLAERLPFDPHSRLVRFFGT